ncbi:hypothetical protein VB264_16355 [Arcicella aquatica]|uniref:Uncharacterized protein n=1 Tax=Arcicella aquatica TaxID=217141 RepID=A0ABU5QQL2_9BACT|nr:hypothetical protein [Arcicella aquatica]MEA5259372.1 hypothetical protein [Arcicella aquatica]
METLELLRLATIETESRALKSSSIEILNYKPDIKKSKILLTQQGTATLFMAKKGEPLLDEIYKYLKSGVGAEQTIVEKFIKQFSDIKEIALEEAVLLQKKQNLLASVRYGGKTLLEGFFIPEKIKVVGASFPYNGGGILEEGFKLIQHYSKENLKEELQCFIVLHEPNLTKAEADILKQLPENQFELNIGTNPKGFATALIAIAAAVSLATGICCPHRNEDFVIPNYAFDPYEVHLPDAVLKQISVSAAASEILKIRRNFLVHKY